MRHPRPAPRSRASWAGACAAGLLALLAGCGAAPTPDPMIDDVFHDVWLRGAPSTGARGRVALTVPGPGPCTDRLLAAAAEVSPPVALTVMLDEAALAAAAADGPALRATLARVQADGHGLGLRVPALPADWRSDPASLRRGLSTSAEAVRATLRAHGIEPPPLRAWRPPSADPATLKAAAGGGRPVVLWSLRAPAGEGFAAALDPLLERLRDGDIVALPAGDAPGCAVAAALPRIAAALSAAELDAVPLDGLLGPQAARYDPPRVVRFRGPPASAACAALEGSPAVSSEDSPTDEADRWGLVHAAGPAGVVVLPLPGEAGSTAALLADRARVEALWARRADWAARPACLRTVPRARLRAPITAEAPPGVWVVGPAGIERRDGRAIGHPGGPAVLPDRADLARFEARQRLPWPTRGVVAGALEALGLDVPLLAELRGTVAAVVGAPLGPEHAGDEAALRRAVAGYVSVAELSLGEYLFLAESLPASGEALRRTARAADGFVRPGPLLVLGGAGRGPDPTRLGLDGVAAFAEPPMALLGRVVAAGHRLAPGDVVAAAPPPPRGAPLVFPTGEAESMGAALRTALGRSLLVAMVLPVYLRPGATRRLDGDLLGESRLRVAVPAGIAAPATEARPLTEQRAPPPAPAEKGDAPEAAR